MRRVLVLPMTAQVHLEKENKFSGRQKDIGRQRGGNTAVLPRLIFYNLSIFLRSFFYNCS